MRSIRTRVVAGAAALVTAAVVGVTSGGVASAAPAGPARLVSETAGPGQRVDITVYSPSMDRTIPLQVLRPRDTSAPAPTLYLLNGAGGGEDSATWSAQTDVAAFFAGKHVNVVTPVEGAFSYYTDWVKPDPGLAKKTHSNGRNMWTTFLTKELPPVIDKAFRTTGTNALAGISMAGTSVLDLAIESPRLYQSIGAYSGCAMTSDPVGQNFVSLVVGLGNGDAENMWGPYGGPQWRQHDPYLNAAKLPRVPMYISSSTGLSGSYDTLANWRLHGNQATLANQQVVGGVIEAATDYCTHRLAERTTALGMNNIRYNFRPTGTHSWGYWQDDLHISWPMIAKSLGL
ncbi:alpha/beta hydrolase family protein [Speluncibacter jeojiensis]|uniref:Esterase family protein n=1 Tax=Speluncibacter jeojiensis TaxID=2710754 RepID=A0A9X4REY7_9ACTN|nr:esterase family protein [Corynebacteriales bacterium D3-21]